MAATGGGICLVCEKLLFDETSKEGLCLKTWCGHVFHRSCINRHLESNRNKCPTCGEHVLMEQTGVWMPTKYNVHDTAQASSRSKEVKDLTQANLEKSERWRFKTKRKSKHFHKRDFNFKEDNRYSTIEKSKIGGAISTVSAANPLSSYANPAPSTTSFSIPHSKFHKPSEIITPEKLAEQFVINAQKAVEAALLEKDKFLDAKQKLWEFNAKAQSNAKLVKQLEVEVQNAKDLQRKAEKETEIIKLRAQLAEDDLANIGEKLRIAEEKLATSEKQLRLAKIEIRKYKELLKGVSKKRDLLDEEKSTENKQNCKNKHTVFFTCMQLL